MQKLETIGLFNFRRQLFHVKFRKREKFDAFQLRIYFLSPLGSWQPVFVVLLDSDKIVRVQNPRKYSCDDHFQGRMWKIEEPSCRFCDEVNDFDNLTRNYHWQFCFWSQYCDKCTSWDPMQNPLLYHYQDQFFKDLSPCLRAITTLRRRLLRFYYAFGRIGMIDDYAKPLRTKKVNSCPHGMNSYHSGATKFRQAWPYHSDLGATAPNTVPAEDTKLIEKWTAALVAFKRLLMQRRRGAESIGVSDFYDQTVLKLDPRTSIPRVQHRFVWTIHNLHSYS